MALLQYGVIVLEESFSHSELGHELDAWGLAVFQTAVKQWCYSLYPVPIWGSEDLDLVLTEKLDL